MTTPYTPPKHNLDAFNCPFCHAYSVQNWVSLGSSGNFVKQSIIEGVVKKQTLAGVQHIPGFSASQCSRCLKWSFWHEETMIFPKTSTAPPPVPDMPVDIQSDYLEAANILNESPRAAAALIRLAVQKLMPHLGQKGKDLDKDIAALVKAGLPPRIQQALDSLRVIGNNAVHPGKMDITDDCQTALSLFSALNMIVEQMISSPRQIEELYSKLPPSVVDAIEKRDGK